MVHSREHPSPSSLLPSSHISDKRGKKTVSALFEVSIAKDTSKRAETIFRNAHNAHGGQQRQRLDIASTVNSSRAGPEAISGRSLGGLVPQSKAVPTSICMMTEQKIR
jgi:hypothetical protein